MRRRIRLPGVACFIFFVFLVSASCWGEEARPFSLEGVEFLSGYGAGDLRLKKDYRVVPFFADFDFRLKPLLARKNIHFPGLLQFIIEPFFSYVTGPDKNVEVGNNFLIKIGLFPEGWTLQPYIKGGAGFLYMSQHTLEEGTQFNFNECIGAGMHYFFRKNAALTLEYRYRHLSNCDIKLPNGGIDSDFVIGGISFLF
ncbi:MAG: acyloxyacyl hydrolase [Candidatus Omnitrophota bacterium]